MPDWIIHLGATHAASRLRGTWDLCWLLVGAVLPDLIPRLGGSLLTVVPPLRPLATGEVQIYISFLHTPLVVALLIGSIAVLARHRRAAAAALTFGTALHFLLDLLQRTYGGGSNMLFPFDLAGYSFQVAWYENPVTYVLVPALTIYLLVLVAKRRGEPCENPLHRWSARRMALSGGLLALALALPVAFIDRAIELNVGGSLLATDPRPFQGRTVEVPVAAVKEVDEDRVHLEIMAEVFGIDRSWLPDVVVGDHVSVKGVYRDGEIAPESVFVHDYAFKRIASLVGALVMLVVWIPALRARRR